MFTEIPKGNFDSPAPCWIPTKTQDGKPCKPVIKCQCGSLQGIALHHVHLDGKVTASFFHDANPAKDAQGYFFIHKGKRYSTLPGCGWHVFLKLKDYDRGEFPPEL